MIVNVFCYICVEIPSNTLISVIMNLYPDKWLALPDGRRYQGETLENSCIPHGLGIITLDDESHFYVGEFAQGKRHGRGFLLTHKQWEAVEPVWVNGTYEEVMATAEFDSCGRVIHTDHVGHYENYTVHHEQWIKDSDGVWADDNFIEPCDPDALKRAPWKYAMTMYDYDYSGSPIVKYSDVFTKHIADADADGCYSFNGRAYVTTYDDNHLLFCDRYGHVFKLGLDETHDYHRGKELHSVHLCLDEPRYADMFENMRFDELIYVALTFSPVMSEKAAKYFLRVFYLGGSVYMLSDDSIEMIRRAADAGNRNAQFAYARYHIIKNIDNDSKDTSLRYLQLAQEQGLYDATAAIAEAWDYGDMGLVNRSKAQQLLREALEHESDYAAIIQLRNLIFGHNGSTPQPELAIDIVRGLRDRDARAEMPSGIWLFYYALALNELGKPGDARDYFAHAARMGVARAWRELALLKAEYNEDGTIANLSEFREALSEGAKHHSAECLTILAASENDEFYNLSEDERTDELGAEIVGMYKKAYHTGDAYAAVMLGDIYYCGGLNQDENDGEAWKWYARAALREQMAGYEKMFSMVQDNLIDADLDFCDQLALNGARLGSDKLLAEVVKAYRQGRLTEYAAEIEQYYCPIVSCDDSTADDDSTAEGDSPESPAADGGIVLKVKTSKDTWVAYGPGYKSEDVTEQVAKVGAFPQDYFPSLIIKEISKDRIVISDGEHGKEKVLTPNGSVRFHYYEEGREWSDGCVCDGTDYDVQIIWE